MKNGKTDVVERIMAGSEDVLEKVCTHPFVRAMADDSLAEETFRFYIVQDYRYLNEYSRAFSVASARAQDLETRTYLADYGTGLLKYEADMHRGYLERFGITQEEIFGTPIALASNSYVSYMIRMAYEGSTAEAIAAVLPCGVHYEVIGKKIVEADPGAVKNPLCGDWIAEYSSKEFAEGNVQMKKFLRRAAEGCSGEELRNLTEIYRMSSRYELGFWDMAWNRAL